LTRGCARHNFSVSLPVEKVTGIPPGIPPGKMVGIFGRGILGLLGDFNDTNFLANRPRSCDYITKDMPLDTPLDKTTQYILIVMVYKTTTAINILVLV
jgi:hypothetical protein